MWKCCYRWTAVVQITINKDEQFWLYSDPRIFCYINLLTTCYKYRTDISKVIVTFISNLHPSFDNMKVDWTNFMTTEKIRTFIRGSSQTCLGYIGNIFIGTVNPRSLKIFFSCRLRLFVHGFYIIVRYLDRSSRSVT